MKAIERSDKYFRLMDLARWNYAEGHETACWFVLLKAAEVNWTSNTPRQIEQRKLASQLRQLTGCIGCLQNLQHSPHAYNFYISRAIRDLQESERQLRFYMATIKERIPA